MDYGLNDGLSKKHDGKLVGYTDNSLRDHPDKGRSTAAYVFKLNNGLISWRTKMEPMLALSHTKAECVALAEAGKEVMYLK